MAFVQHVLFDSALPGSIRQRALDRIYADPGIPVNEGTTSSFWLQTPHPTLSKIQLSNLPSSADTVIIGSGITGASVARTLLQCRERNSSIPSSENEPSVVMLEARDICSGATGRNGGHILETADDYVHLANDFGEDAAKKIMKFRLAHLQTILDVADELMIREECQARKVQFLSVYFDEETWEMAKERLSRFKEAMPEESADWLLYEDIIPEEFHLPAARGVIAGPAGAIWPYKFVTGVLDSLRRQFPHDLHIETNTPVQDIITSSEESRWPFSVVTTRGIIKCRHLVHCTNGHISHLVPGFRGRIYPVRGQMSAQSPGDKFPAYGMKHSWLLNYDRGFDYLTQLPHDHAESNAEMMLGGGFAQGKNGGVDDLGISHDSELCLYIDIHLSGALAAVFGHQNWGKTSGQSVKNMWTGIMGFSADGMPWVGKLPSSLTDRSHDRNEGNAAHGAEWVSAAFSGEGMVQAWLCGKALGLMILDHDGKQSTGESADVRSWFPEQMVVTEERIRKSFLPRQIQHPTKEDNPHL
ncbi:FAD dependent oxidoreductase-domain-containing protein [Talaromyces proteolyticus]|uniref:FAD dependent oxidoreductase-domain-containing protein n=1 Tax=Talaromyces proteolyticus TaxID=1131652 RepID=A0AAD4Q1N9_9EURO|nr:FAD dependent oxidoreductase-domain-containing protein [Talaromyces proteolyticus]KAH8698743.1 FAD dependent oxidoreductase-domain-containing protein [Talaromyces proteolyticus]